MSELDKNEIEGSSNWVENNDDNIWRAKEELQNSTKNIIYWNNISESSIKLIDYINNLKINHNLNEEEVCLNIDKLSILGWKFEWDYMNKLNMICIYWYSKILVKFIDVLKNKDNIIEYWSIIISDSMTNVNGREMDDSNNITNIIGILITNWAASSLESQERILHSCAVSWYLEPVKLMVEKWAQINSNKYNIFQDTVLDIDTYFVKNTDTISYLLENWAIYDDILIDKLISLIKEREESISSGNYDKYENFKLLLEEDLRMKMEILDLLNKKQIWRRETFDILLDKNIELTENEIVNEIKKVFLDVYNKYNNISYFEKIIKKVVEKWFNLDSKDIDWNTSLINSSWYDELECIKILIKYGANINLQNNLWWTALMSASVYGHIDNMELLIKSGAEVNIKNNKWNTALTLAVNKNESEAIKVLVNNWAE